MVNDMNRYHNRSDEPNRYGRVLRISPMTLNLIVTDLINRTDMVVRFAKSDVIVDSHCACESISNDVYRFLGIIVRRISVRRYIVVKLHHLKDHCLLSRGSSAFVSFDNDRFRRRFQKKTTPHSSIGQSSRRFTTIQRLRRYDFLKPFQ